MIVLDSLFATTPRGAALVNRIKADSILDGIEVRILGATATIENAVEISSSVASVPLTLPEGTAPLQLDKRGTRRAPRFTMASDVRTFFDDEVVTLLDLSTLGVQLLSTRTLGPRHRIRLMIGAGTEMYRVAGRVAWAQFEVPDRYPHYRAGIEFIDPDVKALDELCQRFQIGIV